MKTLAWLAAVPLLLAAAAHADVTIEHYPTLIDPRFVPPTAPWVSELPREYPIFWPGELEVHKEPDTTLLGLIHYTKVTNYLLAPSEPTPDTPVEIGPMSMRIRRDEKGRPMLKITRHPWMHWPTEVDAVFEVGVFGDDARDLEAALGSTPHRLLKYFEDQEIQPIDSGWNEEVGVSPGTNGSLYTSFQDLGYRDAGPVEESPGAIFHAHVHFTLSPLGEELMNRTMKHGLFSFPVVAYLYVGLAGAPADPNAQPGPDAPAGSRLTAINWVKMEIPGGLACLHRNFWGHLQTARDARCAEYWLDR